MEDKQLAHVPVGVEDYAELVTQYRCVDKTLLIKEMTDCPETVYLFTRPRRFGKTLNLSMLKTFYEKTAEDTSVYFRDMKIWQCGDRYTSLQGKYPVIYLTLKNAAGSTWETAYDKLKNSIIAEYARHKELRECSSLDAADISRIEAIKTGAADCGEYRLSLLYLSEMLRKKHGLNPVILIDEYDAPLQSGNINGYYQEVHSFLSGFLGAALKSNPNLEFAVMTGVLGLAGDSLYRGLSNVRTYSLLDEKYGEFFGFTRDETEELLEYYDAADKLDEAVEWYEGYRIGDRTVFNPWSVVKYIDEYFEPRDYWIRTGSREGLKQMLAKLAAEDIRAISKGKKIAASIDETADYQALMKEPGNIFTMLLMLGYLTSLGACTEPAMDHESSDMEEYKGGEDRNNAGGDSRYLLAAPNREVRMALRSIRL